MADNRHVKFDLLRRVADASNTDPGQSEFGLVRRPARETDLVLTGTTRRWLRQLPVRRRPVRLCELHPRVVNRIAFGWQDVAASDALLEELLHPRRGGRRGFAPPILRELQRLREFNTQQRVEVSGERFWDRAARVVGLG
jgi:hypothetical protein